MLCDGQIIWLITIHFCTAVSWHLSLSILFQYKYCVSALRPGHLAIALNKFQWVGLQSKVFASQLNFGEFFYLLLHKSGLFADSHEKGVDGIKSFEQTTWTCPVSDRAKRMTLLLSDWLNILTGPIYYKLCEDSPSFLTWTQFE